MFELGGERENGLRSVVMDVCGPCCEIIALSQPQLTACGSVPVSRPWSCSLGTVRTEHTPLCYIPTRMNFTSLSTKSTSCKIKGFHCPIDEQ